ncbi:MAG: ATP-binding protein, partial [Psychrosphaera sp.]|nr:ATP-binding protein [Psychrosphaera sp.]
INHYQHNENVPTSLGDGGIADIIEDPNGYLWVATLGGGLNRLDTHKKTVEHYRHDPNNGVSLSSNSVHALYQSPDGILWAGGFKGLNRLDPATGAITRYQHDSNDKNSLSGNNIMALFGDSRQQIWIGTQKNGLNQFEPASGKFSHYKHDATDSNTLAGNFITSITEDAKQQLWVATYGGGVERFEPKRNRFSGFTQQQGLVSNNIMALLADDKNDLWASSDSGLSRIKVDTELVRNFTLDDGLQDNDFYLRSAFKNARGELFFGGINGYNRFWPTVDITSTAPPKVTFTDFLLFNRSVAVTNEQSDDSSLVNYTLTKSIDATKVVTLGHRQNLFSFEFSALSASAPNQLEYAYQLAGWNEQWLQTSHKKRFATYSNLPGGEYRLNVRARYPGALWGPSTSIQLELLPPMWKTWWAYGLYIVAGLALVVLFYQLTLKKRSAEFQRRLAERESQAAMEIARTKEQLLANVSHEFRTPLTLILGPLESLLNSQLPAKAHQELSMIKRNGQRLLLMVDQLLDLSSLKNAQAHDQAQSPRDVWQTCHFVVESVKALATERHQPLSLSSKPEHAFWVAMVPDALEKILTNLLSNAIKYSGFQTKIRVSIGNKIPGTVTIKVVDNGPGINKADQQRIFERFVRIDQTSTTTQGV